MQKQTIELSNTDRTLVYRGEAVLTNKGPSLNGLGSLECRAYSDDN